MDNSNKSKVYKKQVVEFTKIFASNPNYNIECTIDLAEKYCSQLQKQGYIPPDDTEEHRTKRPDPPDTD